MDQTVEKPLEWLVPYVIGDLPVVYLALDQTRVISFRNDKYTVINTNLSFRKGLEPMRDLTHEDVLDIWKADYEVVDEVISELLDYTGHQDTTINKTNRGYIHHGNDDEETQNYLLRMAKLTFPG